MLLLLRLARLAFEQGAALIAQAWDDPERTLHIVIASHHRAIVIIIVGYWILFRWLKHLLGAAIQARQEVIAMVVGFVFLVGAGTRSSVMMVVMMMMIVVGVITIVIRVIVSGS